EPDLFWGVVNSMYIGNILLLIMSIPLVGVFVKILKVRPAVLAPITVLITLIGVYTVNYNVFDIALVIFFGAVGYLMKKLGFDPHPRGRGSLRGRPGRGAAPRRGPAGAQLTAQRRAGERRPRLRRRRRRPGRAGPCGRRGPRRPAGPARGRTRRRGGPRGTAG